MAGAHRRLTLAALGAVLLMAAAPLPGLPAAGTADPRRRVDMAAAPWRAVALLQIPGLGRCTAFLVAPDVAVTAAHCLWGARLQRYAPVQAIHVLTGYASGSFARHSLARGFRLGAGYDPARANPTRGADVAVVMLAGPVLAAAAVLPLADEAAPGSTVALGGYDQDFAEVIEADMDCHLRAPGRDLEGRALLVHDCAATHGSSGAPLLTRGTDGIWRVLGVQVAGSPGVLGGLAVPASFVRSVLNAGP